MEDGKQRKVPLIDPEEVDEGHWVKLRIPRARGDVDAVADLTQGIVTYNEADGNGDGGISTRQRIKSTNRGVFELLVEEWSFDRKPTGESYALLDDWSGTWVTACLADAMRRGTSPRWAEKNGDSSAKPKRSRSASASANAPE